MPEMLANLLASAPVPPQALDEAVSAGLPAFAVRELVEDGWLTWDDADALIASKRTLNRRLGDHAALTPDESDRLARLIELFGNTRRVFGDPAKAKRWLARPWGEWGDRPRIRVAGTGAGLAAVREALAQIEWGMFA